MTFNQSILTPVTKLPVPHPSQMLHLPQLLPLQMLLEHIKLRYLRRRLQLTTGDCAKLTVSQYHKQITTQQITTQQIKTQQPQLVLRRPDQYYNLSDLQHHNLIRPLSELLLSNLLLSNLLPQPLLQLTIRSSQTCSLKSLKGISTRSLLPKVTTHLVATHHLLLELATQLPSLLNKF
jgi:hypothetical protein